MLSPPASSVPPQAQSRSRLVFLSVLACLVALAALELLARIGGTLAGADFARARQGEGIEWLEYSPTLGWERKPGFKGVAGEAERAFDQAGYFTVDSGQIAASGRKRVLFFGDSNTFGFGASTPESFVEVAEHQMKGVDAINLGVIGYSSYQGRMALARQVPALKPDLVVVSFNVNDRRYVLRPEAHDSPEEFERTWRASHSLVNTGANVLEFSYLYRGLRGLLRAAGVIAKPLSEVDVSRLVPRVDPTSYRHNLEQIVADAKALAVPVMFVILRDNPLQAGPLKKGVESLRKGNLDNAIPQLEQAVQGTPMFSTLARKYLAEALTAKGDTARAAQVLHTRSFYNSFSGGQVLYLDTEYNDIMRDVARQAGADVVEGADALEQQPSDFIDYCHFNAAGHRRLGELLARKITAKLAL